MIWGFLGISVISTQYWSFNLPECWVFWRVGGKNMSLWWMKTLLIFWSTITKFRLKLLLKFTGRVSDTSPACSQNSGNSRVRKWWLWYKNIYQQRKNKYRQKRTSESYKTTWQPIKENSSPRWARIFSPISGCWVWIRLLSLKSSTSKKLRPSRYNYDDHRKPSKKICHQKKIIAPKS